MPGENARYLALQKPTEQMKKLLPLSSSSFLTGPADFSSPLHFSHEVFPTVTEELLLDAVRD